MKLYLVGKYNVTTFKKLLGMSILESQYGGRCCTVPKRLRASEVK